MKKLLFCLFLFPSFSFAANTIGGKIAVTTSDTAPYVSLDIGGITFSTVAIFNSGISMPNTTSGNPTVFRTGATTTGIGIVGNTIDLDITGTSAVNVGSNALSSKALISVTNDNIITTNTVSLSLTGSASSLLYYTREQMTTLNGGMSMNLRGKAGEDPYWGISPNDGNGNFLPDVLHVDVSSFSANSGFVGINKSTPIVNLDVNGTIAASTITAQAGLSKIVISTTLVVIGGPAILQGRSDATAAGLGNYGESVSSSALNATNVPATTQWGDLVSISLTTGTWMISLQECEQQSGATITSGGFIAISTTSGNISSNLNYPDNEIQLPLAATTDGCGTIADYELPISANKTVYAKMEDAYSLGQPTMKGRIYAIRTH